VHGLVKGNSPPTPKEEEEKDGFFFFYSGEGGDRSLLWKNVKDMYVKGFFYICACEEMAWGIRCRSGNGMREEKKDVGMGVRKRRGFD